MKPQAICPKCQHRFPLPPNPGCAKGGSRSVAKGFSDPDVLKKALATRARNRERKSRALAKRLKAWGLS